MYFLEAEIHQTLTDARYQLVQVDDVAAEVVLRADDARREVPGGPLRVYDGYFRHAAHGPSRQGELSHPHAGQGLVTQQRNKI